MLISHDYSDRPGSIGFPSVSPPWELRRLSVWNTRAVPVFFTREKLNPGTLEVYYSSACRGGSFRFVDFFLLWASTCRTHSGENPMRPEREAWGRRALDHLSEILPVETRKGTL